MKYEEIDKDGLQLDVILEELDQNRGTALNHITHELNIIHEYKTGFDEALHMIYSLCCRGKYW